MKRRILKIMEKKGRRKNDINESEKKLMTGEWRE